MSSVTENHLRAHQYADTELGASVLCYFPDLTPEHMLITALTVSVIAYCGYNSAVVGWYNHYRHFYLTWNGFLKVQQIDLLVNKSLLHQNHKFVETGSDEHT